MSIRFTTFDLGAALTGIAEGDKSSVVFDSGMGAAHAEKIGKALTKPLEAVFITHMHADHAGGAAYLTRLQGKDAPVYIPIKEISFTYTPELNADLLYGGRTVGMYQKPFLKAEPVNTTPTGENEVVTIDDITVKTVPTNGHSAGHTAYLVNKTLFLGDALTSPKVTEKHKLLYNYCPEKSLETLKNLKNLDFDFAVLSHKESADKTKILEYAGLQIKHIDDVYNDILNALPGSAHNITDTVVKKRSIEITPESWLLALSSVKGYLSYMERQKITICEFDKNRKEVVYQKPA